MALFILQPGESLDDQPADMKEATTCDPEVEQIYKEHMALRRSLHNPSMLDLSRDMRRFQDQNSRRIMERARTRIPGLKRPGKP